MSENLNSASTSVSNGEPMHKKYSEATRSVNDEVLGGITLPEDPFDFQISAIVRNTVLGITTRDINSEIKISIEDMEMNPNAVVLGFRAAMRDPGYTKDCSDRLTEIYDRLISKAHQGTSEPVVDSSDPRYQIVRDNANCKKASVSWFYIEGAPDFIPKEVAELCGNCVVREMCLDVSIANGEMVGIWGGKSPKERRRLMRNRAIQRSRSSS